MQKKLFIVLLPLLLFSCNKKTSDLEIVETKQKVEQKKEVIVEETSEKQPLINIGVNDTLEIYVRADGAPGMYEDENGELKGFYVELEKAIMEKMGQKYRLHGYYDVGVTVQKIRDGIAHSALSVPDLPDYRTFLHLSIPYEDLYYVTNVHESNSEINASSREEIIKQLFGKKIGVQTRGHIYQSLRDYKEIELIEYATTTQALAALDKGELDAVPDVKRIAMFYSKKNNWKIKSVGEPILSQKITTGFSQAIDPSVVDRYNVALQSLLDSGYVDELYNTYFGHLEQ